MVPYAQPGVIFDDGDGERCRSSVCTSAWKHTRKKEHTVRTVESEIEAV